MRIRVVIILSLVFAALAASAADEKFPVLRAGNEVYSNVTVIAVSASDIYVSHSKGMANIQLKNLDSALQAHFNYDPAKAAAEEKATGGAVKNPSIADNGTNGSSDLASVKAQMEDAMAQVRKIVNQPVPRFRRAPGMRVSVYNPGWFHDGAQRPDFNTVDVRTSRENTYDKDDYATSTLNPGIVFRGRDLEFNPMTKFFYTDRSVPKKKLTEAEMLEINRLYRIIGSCEQKLNPPRPPEPETIADTNAEPVSGARQSVETARSFLQTHRTGAIATAVGLVLFLVVLRVMGKKRA